MSIELTLEEAAEIVDLTLSEQGIVTANMDPTLRGQATVGVMHFIRAMQKLGYRVSRPLREVKTEP